MSGSVPTLAWQWPNTGATAVNYGLDTEIFDSEKFPHVQTFVREAIQNSLDARLDRTQPVRVRFGFHKGVLGTRQKFLGDLLPKKTECGLAWPAEWCQGSVSWLVVEDSNSSGLNGDLGKRTGDFWNYWLNFGLSNKNGTGRGGRGIGRITFLIASGISTVIGVTRRASDGKIAACGMSVLKPVMQEDDFKSSYAYLARKENKSIYDLYDDPAFISEIVEAFETADYQLEGTSGLSLIIPFPHESLKRDSIIASAIEHFAPAILGRTLVIEAESQTVDHATIEAQALRVTSEFPAGPLREDPRRFLDLIRNSMGEPDYVLAIEKVSSKLSDALTEEDRNKIRQMFDTKENITLAVDIPITRFGKKTISRLCVAMAHTPKNCQPTDLFFREGMCLPEVAARNAADVDLVVQSNEGELVVYLNFCEGKAHLGLIENKEVYAKLIDNGFIDGYSIKRFVRKLMEDLRSLVLPDTSKPDPAIFSGFFSVPRQNAAQKPGGAGAGKNKNAPPPPAPPAPPEPQPRIFIVDELPDGFRIRGNPHYGGWPVNLRAEVAYADGTRRPKWSRHDFQLGKLKIEQTGAAARAIKNNVLSCRDCEGDFSLEIHGFDSRRELITNIRVSRNA